MGGGRSVDRARRFFNLGNQEAGGIDVHATVADESAALPPVENLAGFYVDSDSDVEPVALVAEVADRAEATSLGQFRAEIDFRRRTEVSFSFDGATGKLID